MKSFILFLSTALAISVSNPTAPLSNNGDVNQLSDASRLATRSTVQDLVVSNTWKRFVWSSNTPYYLFTNSFYVLSSVPFQLTVTDAYWTGDSFNVTTNGVFDFQTPTVPANVAYTNSPDVALKDPRFSHEYKLYVGGHYTFDVTIRDNPNTSGFAFIRASSFRSCRLGSQQFIIFKLRVHHKDAATVCSEWGYTTAQLNPSNWQAAVNMMQGCLGSFTNAWIGSWNTDSYNGASITLAAGSASNPQGSVVIVDDGLQFPTICQRPDPNAPLIGIEMLPDEA